MGVENMSDEIAIRVGFFISIFVFAAIWELLAPRRGLTTSKTARWVSNLCITFLNSLLVRLLFPILALGMALKAQESGQNVISVTITFRPEDHLMNAFLFFRLF